MSDALLMAILLLSPLVGFLINGFNWRSKNAGLAGTIGTAAAAISFFCAAAIVLRLPGLEEASRAVRVTYFNWVKVGAVNVEATFVIDAISAVMVVVVTGVGSLIHLFSVGYMSHDARPAKFFAYLNLFLFNMLLLILGGNMLVMFVGWEGVGLCSYLLIGFWFKDVEKANAGMKAFIVNRIGDAGLLLGMFILFGLFGTLDFSSISAIGVGLNTEGFFGPLTLACLLLFVGATGKSAQIPLYIWLPDAMAGPTPVSALIHAATMVTAGVYMICRLSFLFIHAPTAMLVVAVIGLATAVFSATIGLAQWDIKKILAYSTVSQLGFMFLACGVGAFHAALFHLMTHAFFKALMFLGSGSVIHAMHEEQDIRKMGGLRKHLPITHATFFCGWLAIMGTPFFSGFYSKDEILWYAFRSPLGNPMFWFLGVFGAALTAFYMTRLMALTFWGKSRVSKDIHPHESPAVMTIPLIALAVLSVVGGYIGIPHVLGHAFHIPNLLEEWLQPALAQVPGFDGHSPVMLGSTSIPLSVIEIGLMVISVSLAGLSAYAAYTFYLKTPEVPKELAARFKVAYKLISNKYFVDEIYFGKIVNPLVDLSRGLWAHIDVNFIDRATYVVSDFVKSAGDGARTLQTGNVQQYALYILLGLILISTMVLL